ncbi:MAG: hypothetical protein IT581_22480 [Verrucomicrobiales bacterium]|nr:hypothetical protein [Verrucomicrobiales bacterium]
MPMASPWRLLCLVASLGFCFAPLATQSARSTYRADAEYLIDTWEAEDGLPENSATAIALGPDGFLWFGTWNGLVRFDGIEFTVFDPKNTPELPGRGIVNLHADRRGRLWVSTGTGLVVLENSKWSRCGPETGWVGNYVRTFASRTNGETVFTTFDGHILESVGDRFRELPRPPGEPDQGYFAAVDDSDRLWVAQNRFAGYLEAGKWISLCPVPPSVTRAEVSCAPARGGGVWILLKTELILARDGQVVRSTTLPASLGGLWSMTEDTRSQLWISSYDSGLARLNPDGLLRRWNHNLGLKAQGVRTVIEDREGNLWIGTSGGGLSRFRPRRAVDVTQGTVMAERHAQSIAPSSGGGHWIASSELGIFLRTAQSLQRLPIPGPQGSGAYGLSVWEDRAGRVWYGEKDGAWWRRPGGDFERIQAPWTREIYLRAIFETADGNIWLGGNQGAAHFDGTGFRFFGAADGLPPSDSLAFGEDAQHRLWTGTDKGLFRLEDHRFTEVKTADGQSIPEVLSFLPEPDGTMWLGTRSRGLHRWREGSLDPVGPAQGLPVSAVHAMQKDDRGFLWLCSNRGVVRVAYSDLQAAADGRTDALAAILIDRRDGLPSVECSTSQPSCTRDAAGQLWFATQRGVGRIDPTAVHPNPVAPPVHLLNATYHTASGIDRTLLIPPFLPDDRSPSPRNGETSAPVQAPLSMPPGSFGLEIRYTAPSFTAPEQVRFQTRLDGTSRHWDDAGDRRVARYEQLPPGTYTFRVRAANNDGIRDDDGVALAFVVQPYYWQTRTFRGALGLLLTAVGASAAWWRTRARRRSEVAEMERMQREMLDRKRTEELLARQRNELAHMSRVTMLGELSGSLAHELNQPLASILSNAQAAQRFLAKDPPDLPELRAILTDIVDEDRRAGEIIRRLRGLLKKGEEQHHELDPNLLVQEVLRLVRNDLLNQGVEVQIDLHPNPPVVLGDRVQLQQVLVNLILNACEAMSAQPRPERRFKITTAIAVDGSLDLTVSDRGPGIPDDKLEQVFTPFFTTKSSGMGLGLSVCRTILSAHHGRLWATNSPDGGAVFHLMLPATKSSPPR